MSRSVATEQSDFESKMLLVKQKKKQAEHDKRLLVNRIALLKKEERKAYKKIEKTKERAQEVLTVRIEHERHHCKKNPKRVKRSFGKKVCKVCGKQLHGAALRAHMATQHPVEFARLEARRPSSRAAKRRELSARRSSERDATAPRSSGDRKTSPRRPTAPVDATVGKSHSRPDKPSGRATKHAWEEMKQKMSRAAAQEMR